MAFNKVVELSIGKNGKGLLISALDIEFEVEKSRTYASNKARFKIYNANENTRKNLLVKGNNLIFKAGYEDETIGTHFIGNIESNLTYKQGVNWVTEITAVTFYSPDTPIEVLPISLAYSPKTPIKTVITTLADIAGLVINGLPNIEGVQLLNGWVFTGTFQGAIRYITNILELQGLGLYVDNAEMVIYKKDGSSIFKTVLLSYKSGLLTVKNVSNPQESNVKRVEFTSLIIPTLKVNGVLSIKNTAFDGSYVVDSLRIMGDNREGEYMMEGTAVSGEVLI